MSKPITLRNLPADLARRVRRLAREKGVSLNRAVIDLLGGGAARRPANGRPALHHDLDWMIGTWSKKQAEEFERALRRVRRIDPELWE